MTDYPSIKPEDVREGDVVRGTADPSGHPATVQGAVWVSAGGSPYIGDCPLDDLTELRLVSRPTPPEPPLRVGDWVEDDHGCTWQIANEYGLTNCHGLTRIEPPVGWPVGVPDPDAPGGVEWYRCTGGDEYYVGSCSGVLSWSELVAAGGVPALAVTR